MLTTYYQNSIKKKKSAYLPAFQNFQILTTLETGLSCRFLEYQEALTRDLEDRVLWEQGEANGSL